MKLYHYCSMRQGAVPGVLTYSSGTISSDANLAQPEQYKRLKDTITAKMDVDTRGGSEVVILSLTVIGEVTPNEQDQPDAQALLRGSAGSPGSAVAGQKKGKP